MNIGKNTNIQQAVVKFEHNNENQKLGKVHCFTYLGNKICMHRKAR